jgi:Cof subfamily protein (haloacid dehalogenase superfamily)
MSGQKRLPRLIAMDIDGTLRRVATAIPPGDLTLACLKQLHEQGVQLGIASGRPADMTDIGRFAGQWGLPFQFEMLIGMNGGQLYDTVHDTFREFHLLSRETIEEIIRDMAPLDLNPFIYLRRGGMMAARLDEKTEDSIRRNKTHFTLAQPLSQMWAVPNNKVLFRVDPEDMPRVEAYAHQFDCDRFVCFKTTPGMLEFQDPRNNKGVALRQYCRDNGIALADVMSFGDEENDTEMLKVSGWSVCLINGSEENKRLADAVTEYDCEHDGVGHYLADHVLNG